MTQPHWGIPLTFRPFQLPRQILQEMLKPCLRVRFQIGIVIFGRIVIDKLYSYSSARRELGMRHKHEPGGAKEAATSQLAEIGICSNC